MRAPCARFSAPTAVASVADLEAACWLRQLVHCALFMARLRASCNARPPRVRLAECFSFGPRPPVFFTESRLRRPILVSVARSVHACVRSAHTAAVARTLRMACQFVAPRITALPTLRALRPRHAPERTQLSLPRWPARTARPALASLQTRPSRLCDVSTRRCSFSRVLPCSPAQLPRAVSPRA